MPLGDFRDADGMSYGGIGVGAGRPIINFNAERFTAEVIWVTWVRYFDTSERIRFLWNTFVTILHGDGEIE